MLSPVATDIESRPSLRLTTDEHDCLAVGAVLLFVARVELETILHQLHAAQPPSSRLIFWQIGP